MRNYWQNLKTHPGLSVATVISLMGFAAGAGNKTAEWWVGGIFGLVLVGGFCFGLVLLSNFRR